VWRIGGVQIFMGGGCFREVAREMFCVVWKGRGGELQMAVGRGLWDGPSNNMVIFGGGKVNGVFWKQYSSDTNMEPA
jgi:hypothetical protein